jgi:hypothetical protein
MQSRNRWLNVGVLAFPAKFMDNGGVRPPAESRIDPQTTSF